MYISSSFHHRAPGWSSEAIHTARDSLRLASNRLPKSLSPLQLGYQFQSTRYARYSWQNVTCLWFGTFHARQSPWLLERLCSNLISTERSQAWCTEALQFAAQCISVFTIGLAVQTLDTLAGQLTSISRQRFPVAALWSLIACRKRHDTTDPAGVGTQAVRTVCWKHKRTPAAYRPFTGNA